MSYCRWSTDNFKCDVYAYESCYGGWQIYIASHRYEDGIPLVDNNLLIKEKTKEWTEQYIKQSKWLETAKFEPIGLPLDDGDIVCETLPDFLAKMQEIKKAGYHIPDWVFDDIKEEIKETINQTNNQQ